MVPTVAPGLVRCSGLGIILCGSDGFHRHLRMRQLGQAEIQHLHRSALGNKDICRLDVAMDNAFSMGGVERIGQLNAPVQQAIQRQPARAQTTIQGVALQQLHGDKRLRRLAGLLDRVNRADVGMVQRRGSARLKQKAVQGILIARKSAAAETSAQPGAPDRDLALRKQSPSRRCRAGR